MAAYISVGFVLIAEGPLRGTKTLSPAYWETSCYQKSGWTSSNARSGGYRRTCTHQSKLLLFLTCHVQFFKIHCEDYEIRSTWHVRTCSCSPFRIPLCAWWCSAPRLRSCSGFRVTSSFWLYTLATLISFPGPILWYFTILIIIKY